VIETYVVGDREVVARLQRMGTRLPEEMKVGIERLTVKLQNKVKADKLSGQVLKVRTGRLRNSIARDVISEGPMVTGMVSTPVVYARPHEFGFSGTVAVREHMRTIKQAFGRPIDPVEATVRAHSMKMNLPERSFLRSSLDEMEAAGTIRGEMEAAVERAAS
jgi:phage gpG-like protein